MEVVLVSRRRLLAAGIVGGLVHFVVIGGLYAYLRGPELFGYSTATNSFSMFEVTHLYILLGAFLPGAVPGVLLVERRLVVPTVTIGVIAISTLWMSPLGLERASYEGPLGPFGFYFAFWFAPLIVATVMGGIEYAMRQLRRENSTRKGPSTSGGNSRE